MIIKITKTIFFLMVITNIVYAQYSQPFVEIIDHHFEKGVYNIDYIIKNSKPDEVYNLKLFLYNNNKLIHAFEITGDKEVLGNQTNTIQWYWSKDRDHKPIISYRKIIIDEIIKIKTYKEQYNLAVLGLIGTKIIIDGIERGTLVHQITNYLLPPGKHKLKAVLYGYKSFETTFNLTSNEKIIDIHLKKLVEPNDDLVTAKPYYKEKTKDNNSDFYPSSQKSEIEFCAFGNRRLSKIIPKWSIYGAFNRQSYFPALLSTAAKYPFYGKIDNRNLFGGGINLTLLPITIDAEVLFDFGINASKIPGSEQITNFSDSALFKLQFYRLKIGLISFVLFERVYPVFGIMSQTAHVELQKGNLKSGINLDAKSLNYQEFGMFANATFRLSDTWVFVVGYEGFFNENAFDGGFYMHLGFFLKE